MRTPSLHGPWPLLAAIVAVWVLVWLTTQVLFSTPMLTGPTVLLGVSLTLAVTWGYSSVVRGPRRRTSFAVAPTVSAGNGSDSNNGRVASLVERLADIHDVVVATHEGTTTNSVVQERVNAACQAASLAVERNERVQRAEGHETLVAIPLRDGDTPIGAIAGYSANVQETNRRIGPVAALISNYLASASSTQTAQLIADARLDALRAQINPHFLFNALNTIAAKSRTDPEVARQLLQRLADFFRYAMQQDGQFAEFAHEYFFVRTYLSLEEARFADRLSVHYDVDPQVLSTQVPALTIQPLVENAVKHGIGEKPQGGTVTLKARLDPLAGTVKISVRDDGVGMDSVVLDQVATGQYRSEVGGVALRNIVERLEALYGDRYRLDFRSSPGKGTRIDLDLPLSP